MVKTFLRYVIPSVVAMWIYAMYTMVDGIFVARGVGEEALAAVNLAKPYVVFIFAVGLLFTTGCATVIAIRLGEGKEQDARELFSMNTVVLGCVTLLITAVTLIFSPGIVGLLGADARLSGMVREYFDTIAIFGIFFTVSYSFETFVKTDGSPYLATVSVLACGLANVGGDYLLVIRHPYGVRGAAVATGFAQVLSVIIYLVYFLKFSHHLKFTRFRIRLRDYLKVIPLGLANGVTDFSGGFLVFFYNRTILRTIGEGGLVSYSVITYIQSLMLNSMEGIVQGMQPLVSYAFGGGDRKACRWYRRAAFRTHFLAGGAAVFALELLPGAYVHLFLTPDSAFYQATLHAVRCYSPAFLIMGINVVTSGYLTAVTQTGRSLAVSLARGLVLPVLCISAGAVLFGSDGIWLSCLAAEGICLVFSFLCCRGILANDR